MFHLENSLLVNAFAKIYVTTFNKYQKNMYYIGLGYACETKINPSSQYQYKKSRKCKELKRLLKEKMYEIKSILRINTQLLNSNVEGQEFNNNITFSNNNWHQR